MRCSAKGPSSVSFCYPASSRPDFCLRSIRKIAVASRALPLHLVMHLVTPHLTCLSLQFSTCLHLLFCLPLSVCLSACLPACLPVCLPACLSACLSVCLSVCLSACLPACLSVCTCPPACPPQPTYPPTQTCTFLPLLPFCLCLQPIWLKHQHMLQGRASLHALHALQVSGGLRRQMSAAWSTPPSCRGEAPPASWLMGGPSIWQSLPGRSAPPLWGQQCMVASTSCRSSLQSWHPEWCCFLHSRALSR